MQKKKISVIVPIYKVSKYLDRCIESIVSQINADLEIILVDDGSPDECPALCDNWSLKDERIKVIHKKNGGLSEARNAGIELASGEYILFIDGDDYIAPNMCEQLMMAIDESSADIALCGFFWQYGEQSKGQKLDLPSGSIILRGDILEACLNYYSEEFAVAWNKLYRRDLFFTSEHIRYPVGRLHEDEYTFYRLLYAAKSVVYVDEYLYYYVQRNNSIMANISEKNLRDYAAAVQSYIPWSKKYAPGKRKVMECLTMRKIFGVIIRNIDSQRFEYGHEIYENLQAYTKSQVHDFFSNPYATGKDKIKYLLFKAGLLVPVMKALHKLKGIS